MKKVCKSLAVFLLLSALAGCSDSWDSLVRDWDVWINEVCDVMLLAKDDATAKILLDGRCKALAARFEKIKENLDKADKKLQIAISQKDKDELLALENAQLDFYYESEATLKRFANTMARMDALIQNTPDNEHLKRLKNFQWGMTIVEFGGTPLDQTLAKDKTKYGGILIPRPKGAK